MKSLVCLLLLILPLPVLAVSLVSAYADRTEITHCGIYRGTEARVLSPVDKATAGKVRCNHAIDAWPGGTYTVKATFVIAATTEYPEVESPKSNELTVIKPDAIQPPVIKWLLVE